MTLILLTMAVAVATMISSLFVPIYAQTLPSPSGENLLPDATIASGTDIESLYNSRIGATQASQQIVNTTRQQFEGDGFVGISCISLIYESPNTLVFDGELLLIEIGSILQGGKYWPNPYVWRAVDAFKAQGYTLVSTELEGQGSRGNPHSWNIVMSKP